MEREQLYTYVDLLTYVELESNILENLKVCLLTAKEIYEPKLVSSKYLKP